MCWAQKPEDTRIKREKNLVWRIRALQGVFPRDFIERLDFANGQPVFANPVSHPYFSNVGGRLDSFETGEFGPGPTSYEALALGAAEGETSGDAMRDGNERLKALKPLVDNPDLDHIYLATTWSTAAGPRESNHVVQITQAAYQEWIRTHKTGEVTRFVTDFPPKAPR